MTRLPANQSDVAGLLNQQAPAIARAIGGATPEERQKRAERFTRVALTTIRNSRDLMSCNQASLMGALMHCASFDMEPDDRGLVWIVPYKGNAQFQLGYKGMIELAYRSGAVKSIYAEIVFEAEIEAGLFEYRGGTDRDIVHTRDFMRPELRQGNVAAAYAVAVMKDGAKEMAVIDRAHIEKRRKASACKGGPWKSWYDEMAKKTAIKELCRTLPQSIEVLHQAITVENEYEAKAKEAEHSRAAELSGLNQDLLGINETGEDVETKPCPIDDSMVSKTNCDSCDENGGCKTYQEF